MRVVLLILFSVLLITAATIAVSIGFEIGLVLVLISCLLGVFLVTNYKHFQTRVLQRSYNDDARIFDGVVITKGKHAVANKSGLGNQYDSTNQIPFIAVYKHGIDGVITLSWSQLKAIEYIGNGMVILELKKSIRFFNTKEVELLFQSEEDAKEFFYLVQTNILNVLD